MLDIAFQVLLAMPPKAAMVCGPMTSGGAGSLTENLKRFGRAIDILAATSENVFTQLPFENSMKVLREHSTYYKGGDHLLDAFYLPIFRSRLITRLYFLPDWGSSYGATWEHERAEEIGLDRRYFVEGFESLPPGGRIFTL